MAERMHVLAQQLLGKNSLEECSITEIRNLVNRYPYLAPAQFLLLHKLQQEGGDEHKAQLQKAILYYPNPLSFQLFIDPKRFETSFTPIIKAPRAPLPETAKMEVVEKEEQKATAPSAEVISSQEPAMETLSTGEEKNNIAGKLTPMPVSDSASPDAGLTFEPFHTVDYFASQGIKLSLGEQPKDKLGKQLKSFTDWLKTMKRLPEQTQGSTESGSERKVQSLAQHSISEADVWTEAMAEVWEKQGNAQKAIEVYNKLSLLNPSKKAYFAAKIEHLKQS